MKVPAYALLAMCCATRVAFAADEKAMTAIIESAATEIAIVQKTQGADAGYAAVRSCYDREFPAAKTLTPKLQGCMTQDIILSNASAALSSQLDDEGRKRVGQGDPEAVTRGMVQRISQIFGRFNVSEADAVAFNRLVNERGTEVYARTLYPAEFVNSPPQPAAAAPAQPAAKAPAQPPAKKK